MKIIVLASQKGGVGKTTLTGHLAVEAEAAGAGPVVLIDTDPQASLAEWWNARDAETPAFARGAIETLPDQIAALRQGGAGLVLIDTPPAMSAAIAAVVALADLVVIPVRPSPHDLRAVGRTLDLVDAAGKPFLFVVTMAKPNSRLTAQAVAALSQHGRVAEAFIGDRVDYAAAMVNGRTARDLEPRGKAASEISALWQQVLEQLDRPSRTK